MNCQEFERQIILFTELSEDEKLKLEVHIQNCAPCKELFASVTYTNSLIGRAAKISQVLQDPTRMTRKIMDRIKKPEHHWWSRFDFSFLDLDSQYIKYGMATISFFMIAFYGVEQMKGPYKVNGVLGLPLQNNSRPVIVIKKEFLKELRKGKAIAKSLLKKNCVSPFNINKVNTACIKQKMAYYKEI